MFSSRKETITFTAPAEWNISMAIVAGFLKNHKVGKSKSKRSKKLKTKTLTPFSCSNFNGVPSTFYNSCNRRYVTEKQKLAPKLNGFHRFLSQCIHRFFVLFKRATTVKRDTLTTTTRKFHWKFSLIQQTCSICSRHVRNKDKLVTLTPQEKWKSNAKKSWTGMNENKKDGEESLFNSSSRTPQRLTKTVSSFMKEEKKIISFVSFLS